MDLKINISSILGGAGKRFEASREITRRQFKINLEGGQNDQSRTPKVEQNKEPRATAPVILSIQNFAAQATQASSKIAELRALQYDYAKQAEKLAEGDPRMENLHSKVQELQSEIERIGAAAYKGQSLTAGITLGLPNKDGRGVSISLPDLSPVMADPNVSLLKPANASAAVDTLEDALSSALTAASGIQSDLDAAKASEPEARQAAEPAVTPSVTEANERARTLASKIAGKYGEPNITAEIVDTVLNARHLNGGK